MLLSTYHDTIYFTRSYLQRVAWWCKRSWYYYVLELDDTLHLLSTMIHQQHAPTEVIWLFDKYMNSSQDSSALRSTATGCQIQWQNWFYILGSFCKAFDLLRPSLSRAGHSLLATTSLTSTCISPVKTSGAYIMLYFS